MIGLTGKCMISIRRLRRPIVPAHPGARRVDQRQEHLVVLVFFGVRVAQFSASILAVIQALGTQVGCRLAALDTRRWLELVVGQQADGMAGGGFANRCATTLISRWLVVPKSYS
jgi:hypothetical protein